MPDRMEWRRMVGSAINDSVGVTRSMRGSALQDGVEKDGLECNK